MLITVIKTYSIDCVKKQNLTISKCDDITMITKLIQIDFLL